MTAPDLLKSQTFWTAVSAIVAVIGVCWGFYKDYQASAKLDPLRKTVAELQQQIEIEKKERIIAQGAAQQQHEAAKQQADEFRKRINEESKVNIRVFVADYRQYVREMSELAEKARTVKNLSDRRGLESALAAKASAFVAFVKQWRTVLTLVEAYLNGRVGKLNEAIMDRDTEGLQRALRDIEAENLEAKSNILNKEVDKITADYNISGLCDSVCRSR